MNNPGVVVISWNHIPFTIQCLQAIRMYTDKDVPILVVDNNTDESEWIKLEAFMALNKIEWIRNETNRGIAPALNQGIKWCQEKELDFCFVSNDIVVGADWLKNLQEGLYTSDLIGGGSPYISPEFTYDGFINNEFRENYKLNYFPRLRQDPTVVELWRMVDELHCGNFQEFTEIWSETRKNLPPYFEWASMVMYLKKTTIEKVGLFDEQFVPSNWEDMDYIVRMNNAGLLRIAVTGSYVFHWSNITNRNAFHDRSAEYSNEMSENEKRFHRKWRVFVPANQVKHGVKDGDKYPPKKIGPKCPFPVSDEANSRTHDEWWTHEEYEELIKNAKKD